MPFDLPAAAKRMGATPQCSAVVVRAILAGSRALGLDAQAILAASGIPQAELDLFNGVLPPEIVGRLWSEILRRAPREELPTEVALAVPLGAFDLLDYLGTSSSDVEAAFRCVASNFRYVSTEFQLEVVPLDAGAEVRVVHCAPEPGRDWEFRLRDEFIIGMLVGRFAGGASGFRAAEVRLTRPMPAKRTRHAELLGAPVVFACSTSALRMSAASWHSPIEKADPVLQANMRRIAEHMGLGPAAGDLEMAVRARLRTLLPRGITQAEAVAHELCLSERTLHRHLHEIGRTYQQVLDTFREVETERLLALNDFPFAQVASQLGFSDQSSWTRAFRRWKGVSPRRWIIAHRRR